MFARTKRNSTDSSKRKYIDHTYLPSHWALHFPQPGDENFIATLEIAGIKMALKLNSTDARGYRAIVGLVDEDMKSTFNRDYTEEESFALNTALTILSSIYAKYGMAIQTEIAGNNSQSVTEEGVLLLGNDKEPSLLHGHIIARGNPSKCYIADVRLRGPEAGKLFNMRGDGEDEGNTSKIRWEEGQMAKVASKLATDLNELLNDHSSSFYKNLAVITMLRPSEEVRSEHRI